MKNFSVVALLLSSAALSGCGDSLSKQFMNPEEAMSQLGMPDAQGPNDMQEEMAKASLSVGDYKRASQFYQQLLGSENAKPEQKLRYKMGYAESLRRAGETGRALELYEQLHKEKPEDIDIQEGRALTMMAAAKTVDAGRAFSAIMEKDPKRWRTLNALGILFVTKNMIPEAMAYYTEALRYSPDNSSVLNNAGLTQAIDHKYSAATETLDQASRLSKSSAARKQIDLNLAMVYGVSGDLEMAKQVASKYYEGAALDNNLGLYAHLAKDETLAKTYLNMALSQSPVFYERAWNNLEAVGGDSGTGMGTAKSSTKSTTTLPKLK